MSRGSGGKQALSFEVVRDLFRGFLSDKGRQLRNSCTRDSLNRTKVAQESALPLIANARNRREFRREVAQFAALAMVGDRETMRLVADHLQQTQDQRV